MRRVTALLSVSLALCLLSTSCVGQARMKRELKSEFNALVQEYTKAEQKFNEPYRLATTDAEREKINLDMSIHPFHAYLPRFLDIEKRTRGTETGARAMKWVIESGMSWNVSVKELPLATLTREYIKSPLLEYMAAALQYWPYKLGMHAVESTLQAIAQGSPHRQVRVSALFAMANMLQAARQAHDSLPQMKNTLEEMKKQNESREMITMLENAIASAEKANVPEARVHQLYAKILKGYADTPYAKQDGKRFRLSDYQGKVVVLDFWGFW